MSRVRKAIVAAVGAGVTALVAVWPEGVTPAEWGTVAGALVAVGLATWATPNEPDPPVV